MSSSLALTRLSRLRHVWTVALIACPVLAHAQGGRGGQPPRIDGPWTDRTLSPDRRAELLVAQMTLDEKVGLLHGGVGVAGSNGGAGFVPGVPRLGIPAIQLADAVVGVTRGAASGRYSTALPSAVAEASTWDVELACAYGGLIGQELHDLGYTMTLGGGVNLTREPRNGRSFEYKGEDPILAGKMVASEQKCLQTKGIISHIKHFAGNDQETGRNIGNVILDKRSLRETDLLPFEIAIRDADIGGVMCSYNTVNSDWSCENQYLMTDFLKTAVGFKGFVLSDWGGTHSTTKAVLAGLDMEQPGATYLGDKLKEAVTKGEIPQSRVDDMVKRILRAQFAAGQFDPLPPRRVVDVFAGFDVAQRVAEHGTVLLKNSAARLPLNAAMTGTIAVIGSHADVGVLSGGGSAQVEPPGGNAVVPPAAPAGGGRGGRGGGGGGAVWDPSSPLKAIRAKAPHAKVVYNDGADVAAAAALAKGAAAVIVFGNQPASEGRDHPNLSLPDSQDKLIAAVAAANPRGIVVLETGGAVTMPWVDNVSAVLESWYPGIRGGEAIANILFGDVNPSGHLVFSFPKSEADLPHAQVFSAAAPVVDPAAVAAGGGAARGGGGGRGGGPFDIVYDEGLKVGYKWYDAEKKTPLFAFGYGLSYTTFAYSDLHVTAGRSPQVSVTVKNTGAREGVEVAQVYASLPASTGEPPKRLVAWQPVNLAPGESKTLTLAVPELHLSIFDVQRNQWQLVAGDYTIRVGGSSDRLPLSSVIKVP